MTEKTETVDIVLLSGYDRMAREMLQDAIDILSGMYSRTDDKLATIERAGVRVSAARLILMEMERKIRDRADERESTMCVGPDSAYVDEGRKATCLVTNQRHRWAREKLGSFSGWRCQDCRDFVYALGSKGGESDVAPTHICSGPTCCPTEVQGDR